MGHLDGVDTASIGGMGTLVGSPPNAIAAHELGMGFAEWFRIAMPIVLVLSLIHISSTDGLFSGPSGSSFDPLLPLLQFPQHSGLVSGEKDVIMEHSHHYTDSIRKTAKEVLTSVPLPYLKNWWENNYL